MAFKLLVHCVVNKKCLGRYFLPCAFRKKKKERWICVIEMMKTSFKTN